MSYKVKKLVLLSPLHSTASSDIGLQGEVPGSNPACADWG
jgi:hypothetical protein